MTEIPPPGPPQSGPPAQPQWQQPGWPQPGYGGQQQWGQQPQWGAPPFVPPKKTNGLAIASLILGLAWLVVGPLGVFTGIAAVITGHIARRQIRERDENGAGLALSGLILGYISIALSILGTIAVIVLFAVVFPNLAQDDAVDSAREFGERVTFASAGGPRSPETIRDVYGGFVQSGRVEPALNDECCVSRLRLADGTAIEVATRADYARNDWKLEYSTWFFGDKYACLALPETNAEPVVVTEGQCSG